MNDQAPTTPPPPPPPPVPFAVSAAASALGRRGKGVPKQFSEQEIAERTARIDVVNERRRTQSAKGTLVKRAVSKGTPTRRG